MLSARELSRELPEKAQTWVNQYLQFTHGNGAVMNFVSKTVGDGFPQYLLENVPAESNFGLNITQPAIYYGQAMPGYRIVATGVKEFDYPKGNDNVYTSYAGKGGIPLDSIWKRLLFSWTKADINILMTTYLTPESRIQIHRDVQERVAQIAPFLHLDNDPYAVLSEGKLYWIQDAYTTSNHYPYANPERTWTYQAAFDPSVDDGFTGGSRGSNPQGTETHSLASFNGLNYIRNSVKVVVDMYDGSVRFFVMDPKDPILAAYREAFPDVFTDLSDLSADLKKHLRYPENLFSIQADQYRTFHMTDPQVFYNREDLWAAPKEKYAGEVQAMEPYYILAKLPGSDQLEYMLMTPFTPQNRDNMISWMAARSDFPQYGKMLFYQLPKEKLVYGPNQIEAMIDQNTTISQQLTLWNQKGSRVIRGKQIVTPIENSFLYVVPLYLTAQGTNFPQLKRVIAVAGDKVVMEPTLDEALNSLFGIPQTQAVVKKTLAPQAVSAPEQITPQQEAPTHQPDYGQARMRFEDAQKAMQQGDWKKFGKAMEELKETARRAIGALGLLIGLDIALRGLEDRNSAMLGSDVGHATEMRRLQHGRTTLHFIRKKTGCGRLARLGHARFGDLALYLALGFSLRGNKFPWNVSQRSRRNFRLSCQRRKSFGGTSGHIGDFRRLQIDEGREMVDPHHWRLHRSRALGVRSHWRGACPRCS